MEDYITRGKNLKLLRKRLGLKQYEITGGEITRNLISLIENDKTPLHEGTARLISENINKISEERNMDIYIYPEDLLNPMRLTAKRAADEYIIEIKTYLEDNEKEIDKGLLEEMEMFLKKWNLPDKKAKAYELLGDIYKEKKCHEKVYMYYTKSLENYFLKPYKKDIHKLILKLVSVCIHTRRYDEAINLSNLALTYADNMNEEELASVHFNKALVYTYIKHYDKALIELKNTEESTNEGDTERIIDILILRANTYSLRGINDKALEIYKKVSEMLLDSEDYEEICKTYLNIVQIYQRKGNKEQIDEYIPKIENLLINIEKDSDSRTRIYLELARIYNNNNEFLLSERNYKEALRSSKVNNDIDLTYEILIELIDLYKEEKDDEGIQAITKTVKDYILNIELDNSVVLLLRFLLLNINENKTIEVKNTIKELLNKGDINNEN